MTTESHNEKKSVALISIFAAILMTAGKLVVGLLTRSLGILSEALHSGLDLVAAVMTYFAVKYSDKPADKEHNFGHNKIENMSALFETMLLLITCVWIIYEAVHRLSTGYVNVEVNYWSFAVMGASILIDWNRSHMLMKAARKHNSAALKADALHFSTDILSSAVVIIGLVGILIGLPIADAIASLAVAGIVLYICYGMTKSSIDVLLDKTNPKLNTRIKSITKKVEGVLKVNSVRTRIAGPEVFAEITIMVDPTFSIAKTHKICDVIEAKVKEAIPGSDVQIHAEPF